MAKSKVKSSSHHNVAHINFLTNVPTKYQHPTSYGVNETLTQHVEILIQHVKILTQHVGILTQHVQILTQHVEILSQHVEIY